MPDPMKIVLSRWELDPPTFAGGERRGRVGVVLDWLGERGVVRPTHARGSWTCTECNAHCRLVFLKDHEGRSRAYAVCLRCSPTEIPGAELDRSILHTQAFLELIFRDERLSIDEIVPDSLWQVGRAGWCGGSREFWFVRSGSGRLLDSVAERMARRRRTILFAPTQHTAFRWSSAVPGPVIGLESVLAWTGDGVALDEKHLATCIDDARLCTEPTAKPKPKRSSRAAKIELLRKELTEHLRAACDHAFTTRDRHGEPRLLPRPTQDELAKRLKLTKSDISRCLRDPAAQELRMLWESALDVHEVMRLRRFAR